MSQSPPASGDRAQNKPAPSPLNPTAAHAQEVRSERAALLRGELREIVGGAE
jgi:hypothetical protein